MSLWRQLTRGLRVLVHRQRADQDIADEVEHYFELTAAEHMARGKTRDDARRAARLELGNTTVVRERVRGYGWENVVSDVASDARHAARRLRSNPGFTIVAALTLALGIGASAAIFSAVNPILLEALPYPGAERIVAIWDRSPEDSRLEPTFGTYVEVSARARSFDALAVMRAWQPAITGAFEPERLDGQRVTVDYFRVLGIAPAMGREFLAAEDRPDAPNVVILGDALWRRRFGGDRALVGREITLDDVPHTVIGIMPPRFENVLEPSAEVWTTLRYDPSLPSAQGREWGHHLRMVGRLRRGVDREQADGELDAIAREAVPQFVRVPWARLGQGFLVTSLKDDISRGARPVLLAVAAAVMLVLLIACVNVTNLLLARGAQRRGEFAMRAALGAGRARLIRQLLTESLLLSLLGGAAGMLVAILGIDALVALSPQGMPRRHEIALDGTVFTFALGVTTVIGLAIGALPALRASHAGLWAGIGHASRRTVGERGATRSALVVAEISLAFVLLVGAGLLLRSLQQLFAVEPGFDGQGVLTMQVQASGRRFVDDSTTHGFYARALDAVRDVPGVTAAAFTSQLPLSGDVPDGYGVAFETLQQGDESAGLPALRYAVTPGYFETLGIPLRRGRLLDTRDGVGAPAVVLINESFARRVFGERDPVGERIRVGSAENPWSTIVGVVGDVKQASLAAPQLDAVYMAPTQWQFADATRWLVVRARGDAAALAPPIRRAIWSVDADRPIVRTGTMDGLVAASAAEQRFALIVFEAFAIVALMLAATGLYGVLAGSVAERVREIGVRAALGATRSDILGLVLRRGLVLSALGIALGLIGAIVASRGLVSLLFRTSELDPITYAAVIALLMGVSCVACWVPARRAASVDPSIALRAES